MAVERLLPTSEAEELIALTRDIGDKVLTPIVDAHEKAESYPDGVFDQLGAAGLLSLPQPTEWGGGGPPIDDRWHRDDRQSAEAHSRGRAIVGVAANAADDLVCHALDVHLPGRIDLDRRV